MPRESPEKRGNSDVQDGERRWEGKLQMGTKNNVLDDQCEDDSYKCCDYGQPYLASQYAGQYKTRQGAPKRTYHDHSENACRCKAADARQCHLPVCWIESYWATYRPARIANESLDGGRDVAQGGSRRSRRWLLDVPTAVIGLSIRGMRPLRASHMI